jgi:hypothetical protein
MMSARLLEIGAAFGVLAGVLATTSAPAGLDPTRAQAPAREQQAIAWAALAHGVGKSPVSLPASAVVKWRTALGAALAPGLSSDGHEHVLAATQDARLIELDQRGRRLWSRRLRGVSESPPVVLANGDRAVLEPGGHFRTFNRHGEPLVDTLIDNAAGSESALLLAMHDGSAVLAKGEQLWWLEFDGALRATTTLSDPARRMMAGSEGLTVLTTAGTVAEWNGSSRPTLVPHGVGVTGAVSIEGIRWLYASDRELFRVTRDGGRARWLELASGQFVGALAPLAGGRVAAYVTPHTLVVAGPNGENRREVLGSAGPEDPSNPITLLTDEAGRIAVTTNLGQLVLIDPGGGRSTVEGFRCPGAAGVVPTGQKSLVVACRNGTIYGLTEK